MRKYLAILFLLIGLVAIIYTSAEQEHQYSPVTNAGGQVKIVPEEQYERILIEAESAVHVEPPMQIRDEVLGASNEKSCYIGPERVNEKPEVMKYTRGYDTAVHPGFASYRFFISTTGRYEVWLRTQWSDSCGNSIDIAIDGTLLATVQGPAGRLPTWRWVKAGTKSIPVSRLFKAGSEHELRICNREDDLSIDQILLLLEEDPFEPSGILNNAGSSQVGNER
jgi:hypothetical protein